MLNKFRMNGAEAVVSALAESGIEVVFGIPGVHNLSLFEALRRSTIRVVAAAHEQGAAFMANGYGRATGKPGVFISVPGPGLTNSLTPVAEALVDSTPMLGIVTEVPQSEHKYQMHEIKQEQLAGAIVKSVRTIQHASDIPTAVKHMLRLTTQGEPGPCIIQIPGNVYWNKADRQDSEVQDTPSPDRSQEVEAVISRLISAKQVGLFVGLGAADAAREICMLAELLNAPVATTGSGRGVLDETHPLSLGFAWGAASVDPVNRLFAKCDLILAIGVKFSQNGTHDYRLRIECPLIHVDSSVEVLGRNYKTEIALQMDARQFLRSILEQKSQIGQRHSEGILESIRIEKEACETRLRNDASTQFFMGEQTISPLELFEKLRGLLPNNAILVTDAGFNERLTIKNWLVREPRTLINPSNYECMGFAIPTAIGAALAFPDRKVVAITGDGGLVMSGLEMMTAVREKLNLTIVVLNNNGFGIIKKIQQDFFGASIAADVGAPDFKALAESVRMDTQPTVADISALEQAIQRNGPVLLEVGMQHRAPDSTEQLKKRLKNDLKQGLQKFIR